MDISKKYGMIPQSAVKQCLLDVAGYNAAWDYHITPSGRHFIPCCAEGTFPEYVHLYEYFPETNELKLCFKLDEKITVYPRTIRPSKFHTSINSMPDGKLIMVTHTTASAPGHPANLPNAYYTHMWEGYMGSNVLIYDPDTGKLEDLGIPVPRESVYGAKYIPEHNVLFFLSFFRGHGYLFDLETRDVTDLGQLTEFGTFQIVRASDGNLYFSTRSGDLWRLNTKSLKPEFTGIELPRCGSDVSRCVNCMSYAETGPDGRLYMTMVTNPSFHAYDPKTNTLETLGYTTPADENGERPAPKVFGMQFDEEGKLWYTSGDGNLHLYRTDITNPSAEPEDFGIVGTEKRGHFCVESIYLRDGILYMSDTNHGPDAPGIVMVDTREVLAHRDEPRVICQDPAFFARRNGIRDAEIYKGDIEKDGKRYLEFGAQEYRDWKYLDDNPYGFGKKGKYVAKLWKKFPIDESQVRHVEYDREGNVLAYIDADGGTCVKTHDGEIISFSKERAPVKDRTEIEKRFEKYILPAHPGRQFLARASACCELYDGTLLVGTGDGMLASIKGDKVFSYGAVINDGPIRDIAASPDRRRAYGVGGDMDSPGVVFTFDVDDGVTIGGSINFSNGYSREGCGVSSVPCCIAVNADGSRIAIGVLDKLGCVYEFEV